MVSQLGLRSVSVRVVASWIVWWYGDTVQISLRYLTPFRLHPALSCGSRLVVDNPVDERHASNVRFRLPHLCNIGIAGMNFQKLSEIGAHVTNAGIPFIIAGDWNVPPSELLGSRWPARISDGRFPPI